MKTTISTKTLLYAGGIIVTVLAILIFLFVRQINRNGDLSRENVLLKQTTSILSNNIKVSNDTMEYWKDKAGNQYSEIKLLSATNEMMENQYSNISKKYNDLLGKSAKDGDMIAYLETQVAIKDQIIQDLTNPNGNGSYILNDSTIAINVGKSYDSINYYNVDGTVTTRIKNNKIFAGTVDLTTTIGFGVDFGISRDKKTGMASITSKTAFKGAKVNMGGITHIEKELNKRPSAYLGLGLVLGYGSTLQQSPQFAPFIGLAAYISPRWLTIKIRNR